MQWVSPTGRVFSDPTDALCDALANSSRIREAWCPRTGDLAVHANICAQAYWTLPRVRNRVDAILADAGYICNDWARLALEPRCKQFV